MGRPSRFTCNEHQTRWHASLEHAEKDAAGKEAVIIRHSGGGRCNYAPQDDVNPKKFPQRDIL
jgi:hypothetical protein